IFELERRSPTPTEIYWRLAWAMPLALITTVLTIQAIRKIWRSIPHKSKAALSERLQFTSMNFDAGDEIPTAIFLESADAVCCSHWDFLCVSCELDSAAT